jgi:hypothetical protein
LDIATGSAIAIKPVKKNASQTIVKARITTNEVRGDIELMTKELFINQTEDMLVVTCQAFL